jgi:hypothetical protein
MRSTRKSLLIGLTAGLLLGLSAVAAVLLSGAHAQVRAATPACGKGTIAFAAPTPHGVSAPQCLLASFFDHGKRRFVAHLLRPARTHQLEIDVSHVPDEKPANDVSTRGLSTPQYIFLKNPNTTVVRGTINYSGVEQVPGDSPYGRYYLSIYRDFGVAGRELLAVGEFDVLED